MKHGWPAGGWLREVIFSLALIAFGLQLLVPPGYMVGRQDGGPAHIVICTGHGPVNAAIDLGHSAAARGKKSEAPCDTLPGTGAVSLTVGGYHFGKLGKSDALAWFTQARFQAAVATQGGYRPGDEVDSAIGVSYDLGRRGPFTKVAPLLQVLDSYRAHDSGPEADPLNSGYERMLISSGVDIRLNRVRIHGDVEVSIYQHVNAAPIASGNSGQLVAPILLKVQIAYDL